MHWAFRGEWFERIFTFHEQHKSLIARVFIWWLIYHMTEKIMISPVLVYTVVQIKY